MTLFRTTAAALLLLALTACDRLENTWPVASASDRSPPTAQPDTVLSSWADRLVSRSHPRLIRHLPPVMTLEKTYRVDFLTTDTTQFVDRSASDPRRDALFPKQKITDGWTEWFCSHELREIMQSQGIRLTIAGLREASGAVHAVGVCKL